MNKAIAGTEVTSDIVFLKKRETPLDYYKDDVPDWAKQPESVFENGRYKCCINKYFVQHPNMILGDMQRVSGQYGNTETWLPRENQNLAEELKRNSVKVNEVFGTKRMNAYEIMEASLNLKRVEIKDKKYVDNSNGETVEKYVLNKNETMLARERQSKIENAFKKWILAD